MYSLHVFRSACVIYKTTTVGVLGEDWLALLTVLPVLFSLQQQTARDTELPYVTSSQYLEYYHINVKNGQNSGYEVIFE